MPTDAPAKPASDLPSPQPQAETIKDTLISIMIAFTMAFVFRGFVIEAFVIPTGSMAPTLMGAHMPLRGVSTGYTWPVGAYLNVPNDSASYESIQPALVHLQGGIQKPIDLQDPVSGELIAAQNRRCYSGDRILVLKYLYGLRDPNRFDVIVFKDPQNTANNFIKRLIGLPGEQIALADGDVFVRTTPEGRDPPATGKDTPEARAALWEHAGWHIARKDPIVQRAVWQLVYDSSFAPLTTTADTTPWLGRDKQWSITPREYRYPGTGTTGLVFDQTRRRSSTDIRGGRGMRWAIDDYYPYDEAVSNIFDTDRFPVSDVRLRCGFRPEKDGQTIAMLLDAREHEFRATIGNGAAKIELRRPVGGPGVKGEWETVVTQTAAALPAGTYSNVEFWHVDQSVQIWLDGKQVAHYEYDWSPGERLLHVTGQSLTALMQQQARDPQGKNQLSFPNQYTPCTVGFEFTGGPFTVTRVGLDRDLYYRPASKGGGISALGTSPFAPLILGPEQFFACGDNSPQSLDGRLWESVDPWVQELYPPPEGPYPTAGVIPRELLLGKAFFVYWPSLKYAGEPVPMPDFGRMRFIW